ncbi:substrate-binding periplasmic protein [Curvivirga sp.]|uniref:substrate-binding periplasmic protein n=1 Tax=Curvivirga sp. TaxID=2856848 RepID=UPI003B5C2A3F
MNKQMKQGGVFLLSYLLVVLFLRFEAQADQNCGDVRIGWIDWPPYQYKSSDHSDHFPEGIDIDISQDVFTELGCNIVFVHKPWKRLFVELEAGQIHVLPGISYTEERAEKFLYSSAYRTEELSLFVRKADIPTFNFDSFEELFQTDFRLGIPRSSYLGPELTEIREAQQYENQIFERTGGESLEMIIMGRVDGFLIDHETGIARMQASEKYRNAIGYYNRIRYSIGDIHFLLNMDKFKGDLLSRLNAIVEARVP